MATRGWQNVTADQVARVRTAIERRPPSKYRNVRFEIDGVRFDSKAEAEHWVVLRAREAAGEITALRRQVAFELFAANPRKWRIRICEYVADFTYVDAAGRQHVVDVKRKVTRTAVYQLKKKWLELQDGIVIEEVA